jgi:hypothetical protein
MTRRPRCRSRQTRFGARLDKMWETAPGLYGWLASVDHKEIGIRYIITAFAFLIAGGTEALIFPPAAVLVEPASADAGAI